MPKLKIVKPPPDRSDIGTALASPPRKNPDILTYRHQAENTKKACGFEVGNGKICGDKPLKGGQYCYRHTPPEELPQTNAFEYTRAPQVMDVFNAYTEGMEDADKDFMLQVYGDWNLDPEIALLRLAIKHLVSNDQIKSKAAVDSLPRLVQSLTAAVREALSMVEGGRMVVDFSNRAGRTYWKELFRAFQSMVEELHGQMCPHCQEVMQHFVHGGTENVPQFTVIDVNATGTD
jgi:hypothetical protein